MAQINGRDIVRLTTAAEIMGCTRRTVYNYITDGTIETAGKHNGSLFVFKDTLPTLKEPRKVRA